MICWVILSVKGYASDEPHSREHQKQYSESAGKTAWWFKSNGLSLSEKDNNNYVPI